MGLLVSVAVDESDGVGVALAESGAAVVGLAVAVAVVLALGVGVDDVVNDCRSTHLHEPCPSSCGTKRTQPPGRR